MIHDLLLDLKIFRHLNDKIEHADQQEITETAVLEDLVQFFPNERPKNLFKTIVSWARFAELFSYEPKTGLLKRFEKKYLGKPPARA